MLGAEPSRAASLPAAPGPRLRRPEGAAFIPKPPEPDQSFEEWLVEFRGLAERSGVTLETLDRVFGPNNEHVIYNDRVNALNSAQPEFEATLPEYLSMPLSPQMLEIGRSRLDALEAAGTPRDFDGVPREMVSAIWGMESSFGRIRGQSDGVAALASQAWGGTRPLFAARELRDLLLLDQAHHANPSVGLDARETPSGWAGAYGHTQFMPSTFFDHAVDGDGDGDIDLTGDDPADALASTAHYLREAGWVSGQPVLARVELPEDFDYTVVGGHLRGDEMLTVAELRTMGVTIDGDPEWRANILLPEGHEGAAFAAFQNFDVLKTYNQSDSYAWATGMLFAELSRNPVETDWLHRPGLNRAEREEFQALVGTTVDAMIGPATRRATQLVQQRNPQWGPPDGFPDHELLGQLRAAAADEPAAPRRSIRPRSRPRGTRPLSEE